MLNSSIQDSVKQLTATLQQEIAAMLLILFKSIVQQE